MSLAKKKERDEGMDYKKTAQEILNTDTKFKSADEALKEVTEHVKSNPL